MFDCDFTFIYPITFLTISHTQANELACIQNAAELWTTEPEAGKTTIRQTPQFREAVKTCLTEGCAPLAIALAIHDKAINDGHYSGESRGKGMNYETIVSRVYTCKKALQNQNKQTV